MKEQEKFLKRFNNFVDSYENGEDIKGIEAIELKRQHRKRVLDASKYMAKTMNLPEEDETIAEIIAILHDIGRFEQWKKNRSYVDTERIQHAYLGAQMLQKGWIRYFIPETREYDEIIIKAVKLHRELHLPHELTERERFFCNLIRDADRIDIFYQCTRNKDFDILFEIKEEVEERSLSNAVKLALLKNESISFKEVRNRLDLIGLRISLLSQFTFKSGIDYIKEKGYVEKMINLFENNLPQFKGEDLEWLKKYASKAFQSKN